MKAMGKILKLDGEEKLWARIEWRPSPRLSFSDCACLSTLLYVTEPEARQAAEKYATALGLEIEWEEGTP